MASDITIEITQNTPKLYSSYVAGCLKTGNIVLGMFELNIPDPNDDAGQGPRQVIIWSFEILPEHRNRGLGRASYVVLERMILQKYEARAIYLEIPFPQMIDGKPWDPKGFWEKVGYVATDGRQMRKTDFKQIHAKFRRALEFTN